CREKRINNFTIWITHKNVTISTEKYGTTIGCSSRRIIDRIREVLNTCEIGTVNINVSYMCKNGNLSHFRELIEHLKEIQFVNQLKIRKFFPILELPAELSSKILSYMGRMESRFCLQSFALDKGHAEWNDNRIGHSSITTNYENTEKVNLSCSRYHAVRSVLFKPSFRLVCNRFKELYEKFEVGSLDIELSNNVDQLLYRDLIESCVYIQCSVLFQITIAPLYESNPIFTDELIRKFVSKKKEVCIWSLCCELTAAGLRTLWEDILYGKFDGLHILVNNFVADELFDGFGNEGDKNSPSDKILSQIESDGRIDKTKRYEIWRQSCYDSALIQMSRIYDDRPFKSSKYYVKEFSDYDEDSPFEWDW
ncbi:hypothetical protein PFISCL1PPCAC_21874, partial [Pristionchus fissidentatus]